MSIHIRSVKKQDIEEVVQLSLAAWAPFSTSLDKLVGPQLSTLLEPDWQTSQREDVANACHASIKEENHISTFVAETDTVISGFVSFKLDNNKKMGIVEFLAVRPHYQEQGIGTALNQFAMEVMRDAGMQVAMVETGGDPYHEPARKLYEKAGYTHLPIARYFQKL
jgi:GNAT superfamily N-acetyltransferase